MITVYLVKKGLRREGCKASGFLFTSKEVTCDAPSAGVLPPSTQHLEFPRNENKKEAVY